jgi:hypothetical protein
VSPSSVVASDQVSARADGDHESGCGSRPCHGAGKEQRRAVSRRPQVRQRQSQTVFLTLHVLDQQLCWQVHERHVLAQAAQEEPGGVERRGLRPLQPPDLASGEQELRRDVLDGELPRFPCGAKLCADGATGSRQHGRT